MARNPDFKPRHQPEAPKPPRGGARKGGGRKKLEGHSYLSLRLEGSFLATVDAAARVRGVGRQQFLREALRSLLDAAESDATIPFLPVLWWRNREMTSVILPDTDIERAKGLVTACRAESLTDVVREAGLRAARAVEAGGKTVDEPSEGGR
jgi:hypothetical protein